MIRVLIAEDEEIERLAFHQILLDHLPSIEVVGLAVNGREAIRLSLEHKPDLILVDIKMPGVDGLKAVEVIRSRLPQTKVIIVSSYDTFTFAQQALRLGVTDYLLKPSKTETIVQTVRRVCEEIRRERAERTRVKQMQEHIKRVFPIVEADFVMQLLSDHIHDVHIEEVMEVLEVKSSDPAYVLVLFINIDSNVTKEKLDEVYGKVKARFHKVAKGFIGALSGSHIPMIIFADQKGRVRHQALQLVQQLRSLLAKDPSFSFFFGIGQARQSVQELRGSYHEALLACADLSTAARYRFYEDMVREQEDESNRIALEKRLLETVRDENWEQAQTILDKLLTIDEQNQVSISLAQQHLYGNLIMVARYLEEMGLKIHPSQLTLHGTSFPHLRSEVHMKMKLLYQCRQQLKKSHKMDTAYLLKQYIEAHYQEDLSLEQLADYVQLSPYYVSKLFKEEFQMSFIDYLTKCRIHAAKEFIRKGEKSIKEIAFEVGYHDPNYFSRVFKKVCNLSPSSYKAQITKGMPDL